MGRAKDIIIKVIPKNIANEFVKKHHYSKKIVNNSTLHLGAFIDGKLHGVMQFGHSINKKYTSKLVKDTGWNEFIELNRMAFDDYLPKNSESRCISIAMKLIKKNAPHVKWVITFADGTQCGDGTIYRASNFKLLEIRTNDAIRINPETGEKMHTITAHHNKKAKEFRTWEKLEGYQLKYVYFIDKNKEKDLTVPVLEYSEIDKKGAGMYKGVKK